jgi:polysaccharide export outer membrane protein
VEDSTATVEVAAGAFTIGPRDRVSVNVFGLPDYSTPTDGILVSPEGTVGIPLLGQVWLAGLTVEEAGAKLAEELRAYLREPSVTVSILEYASRRFFLLGEVKRPGPYPLDGPTTALEALSMSGGWVTGARLDPVVILRKRGDLDIEVIPFNAQTPGPDGWVQVRPDDVVFVPRSGVGVFLEEYQPYWQAAGWTVSQVASAAIAYDRVFLDN